MVANLTTGTGSYQAPAIGRGLPDERRPASPGDVTGPPAPDPQPPARHPTLPGISPPGAAGADS